MKCAAASCGGIVGKRRIVNSYCRACRRRPGKINPAAVGCTSIACKDAVVDVKCGRGRCHADGAANTSGRIVLEFTLVNLPSRLNSGVERAACPCAYVAGESAGRQIECRTLGATVEHPTRTSFIRGKCTFINCDRARTGR